MPSCKPTRVPRPNCPVGKLPAHIDYRRPAADARPLVLCLGDSVSAPSCRAAAASVGGLVALRSVEFPRGSGTVLLNTLSSANLRKCVASWMGKVRWRAVVFGAGAWDLSSGNGYCEVDAARLEGVVDNIRAVVAAILERAELAVWVTTTPIAETAVCCRSSRLNYSMPPALPVAWASIGYCHADARAQNAAVARALERFPPHRVATADTYAAVARACGAQYTDCPIQSQAAGCQAHFSNASLNAVHGPAIGAVLAAAMRRGAGHGAGIGRDAVTDASTARERRLGGRSGQNRRRHLAARWL